jgi:CBS domain-containing protein
MARADHDAHPALGRVRVDQVMSAPIQACESHLTLPAVAELMASRGIHCVAVVDADGPAPNGSFLGVLTDLDLVAAADAGFDARTAAQAAEESSLVSVPSDAPLSLAVRVMREERAHHLVAVDAAGTPVGVLSTLDVARVLADAPAGPGAP